MKEKIITFKSTDRFKAKLDSDPRLWGPGMSRAAAIRNLLVTLKTFGKSDKESDYEIVHN